MTNEFGTIEDKIETEFKEIETDIKLDYKKVIAILRAHFGGDHPVIVDMKKLGGESSIPESVSAVECATPIQPVSGEPSDPKPVDTIPSTGIADTVSGS